MPLVTIILTTLNSERSLARSIQSCLDQTHRDLELLIVDGGSTDRTLEIVSSIHDPRIRVVHQQDNTGKLPGAINLGMANARGEFITWTQDDCWFESNAIEVMKDHLDSHPEVALVYTDFRVVDEQSKIVGYISVRSVEHILEGDLIGQCFLFRRTVYETIGPQDCRYFPVHEVPWRVKLAARFSIEPLHVPLFSWTIRPGSLTWQIGNWRLALMSADALRQEGHLRGRAYRRRVAQIHVDQAYREFIDYGHFAEFWRCASLAIQSDPGWLKDRGFLKLLAVSLLPSRHVLRQRLAMDRGTDGWPVWPESDVRGER